MSKFSKGISDKSIFSTTPDISSSYEYSRLPSNGLMLDSDEACRLYVENWDLGVKIPSRFITNQNIRDLVTNPTGSVISPSNPYTRFLMDSVQMNFQEGVTPIKNLNHGFVTYVFEQEPPIIPFSGILLHTVYDNWSELFLALYQYVLRASKLAELSLINAPTKYQVVIRYQGKILKGSIISLSKSTSAQVEQGVRFNFNFLLKQLDFVWEPIDSTVDTRITYNEYNPYPESLYGTPSRKSSVFQSDNNSTITNPGFNPTA